VVVSAVSFVSAIASLAALDGWRLLLALSVIALLTAMFLPHRRGAVVAYALAGFFCAAWVIIVIAGALSADDDSRTAPTARHRNTGTTPATRSRACTLPSCVRLEGAIYTVNTRDGSQFDARGALVDPDDDVAFEAYYHNLEDPDSGRAADQVRLSFHTPAKPSTSPVLGVTIKAANSNEVEDSTRLLATSPVSLTLVPGSVTWRHNVGTNSHPHWITDRLPDFTVNAPRGTVIDKVEQPSNNFSGTVRFEMQVVQGD
jgi:hypothetical protein